MNKLQEKARAYLAKFNEYTEREAESIAEDMAFFAQQEVSEAVSASKSDVIAEFVRRLKADDYFECEYWHRAADRVAKEMSQPSETQEGEA